jgi:5-methylcytosine-specific restriction enzyme subunit McrC
MLSIRTETLVESTRAVLSLTQTEAAALQAAGRRLASNRAWWGESAAPPGERTVIRCNPLGAGQWEVRVSDAIGLISINTIQLVIKPKIDASHLLFLFAQSGRFPRLDSQRAFVIGARSFWDLIARWFVVAAERLLHGDLVRDYEPCVDELKAANGSIMPLPTARVYYAGRLSFVCRFEEFAFDTPLNRLIRAAALAVSSSQQLDLELRKRALRLLARLQGIGPLRHSDLNVVLERKTRHYSDAASLAVHVLRSVGRTLAHGQEVAWTFLLRTPDAVEEGVRRILQRRLGVDRVQKKGLRLQGSAMTVNPDLVIDEGVAVADVKYKLARDGWERADLYEVNAFANQFGTRAAAIVNFDSTGEARLNPVKIGETWISHLTWNASGNVPPQGAADLLSSAFEQWVELSGTLA